MGIQSITAKSKHKWDCTCRGTSGYAAAEVALKLTIYSLHVWGEKIHDGLKAQFWLETVIRICSRD